MPGHEHQTRRERLRRAARSAAAACGAAAFVLGPSLAVSAAGRGAFADAALVHGAIYLLAVTVLRLTSGSRLLHRAACAALGAYFVVLSGLVVHWLALGQPFDPRMITESPVSAIETAWRVAGWEMTAALLGLVVACAAAAAVLRAAALRPAFGGTRAAVLSVLALAVLAVRDPAPSAMAALMQRMYAPATLFEDTASLRTDSRENVFILQLESGNSLALQGKLTGDGRNYMPVMQEILSRDGVFFPEFWGSSVTTTRGMESILCGTVNNLGEGYTERPEELPVPCLPKLLSDSGYDTLLASSFWNGEFFNRQQGLQDMGFRSVMHGTMMEEDDPWYEWGYDDCTFYDRVFDHLEREYADREGLLVYVEVSANHWPFDPLEGYEDLFPFPGASTQLERYLNSAAVQDACIARFYDRYRSFAPERSHLLVLPDHSFPMGVTPGVEWTLNGAYVENYLITFGYVPPDARKDEFVTGTVAPERRFAQPDIVPTIFELLNGRPYANSFGFRLRRDAPEGGETYEDCHVMAQPYVGGATAVVRGDEIFTYWHDGGRLEYADLSVDPMEHAPTELETGLSYSDFWGRYGCARYGE